MFLLEPEKLNPANLTAQWVSIKNSSSEAFKHEDFFYKREKKTATIVTILNILHKVNYVQN